MKLGIFNQVPNNLENRFSFFFKHNYLSVSFQEHFRGALLRRKNEKTAVTQVNSLLCFLCTVEGSITYCAPCVTGNGRPKAKQEKKSPLASSQMLIVPTQFPRYSN